MNRLLGPAEFQMWLLDRHAPYNATMIARLWGRVDVGLLRQALVAVQARHPILRARIVPEPRPRYVSDGVAAIPLRVLERQDEGHWRREVMDEVPRAIPLETGPLMRATLLNGQDRAELLFSLPHIATDGRGIVYLLRDLLSALDGTVLSPLPEWPSCEELIPPSAYTRSDGAEVMNSWWSRKTSERFKALSFKTLLADLPRLGRTHAHPVRLSKAETSALLTRCRHEEASLHGALLAALMLNLVTEETTLRASHPFDLRAELQPPVGDDLGLFIGAIWTEHDVSPASHLWDVARDVTGQILEAIARRAHFDEALKMRQNLAPNSVLDIDKLRRTLTISDLGQLPIPTQYGALTLRELFITGFMSVQIPILSTCLLGGRLCCLVNHSESWRSAVEGEAYSQALARTLTRAVEQP
jgi:phthiocerol/phthiodiolone dimycocerosyl transferase-like enzyme